MLSFVGNLDTTSGLYESRHGEKEREEGEGERGNSWLFTRKNEREKLYQTKTNRQNRLHDIKE